MIRDMHIDRWADLLAYQQTTPFTPTLAEIAELWGVGKSGARNTLYKLMKKGYIISHKNKRYSMYLAISGE